MFKNDKIKNLLLYHLQKLLFPDNFHSQGLGFAVLAPGFLAGHNVISFCTH